MFFHIETEDQQEGIKNKQTWKQTIVEGEGISVQQAQPYLLQHCSQ